MLLPDAVAYAALLRNELLGAGIESVPDPHTDERRHTVLSQDSHSLFRVWVKELTDLTKEQQMPQRDRGSASSAVHCPLQESAFP